ncbi:MAG: UDP-N-acetylglucosamine 1-carboxyvinyltransferase [Victivallales bacterium]|nr:UDP-N-acetylglucosamine 1-carboxyvinyltransferase [Victivallales bacterium]
MDTFRIKGGCPLSGSVRISGNKNSILPMIAASLLTDEEVVLRNVPDILDVRNMLEAADHLGVQTTFRDKNTLVLCSEKLNRCDIPRRLSSLTRTSILFAGPLLHRCGRAVFFSPGGDGIGRRRLDSHFYGLTVLGAEYCSGNSPFKLTASRLRGREMFFDEASVTATEHIMTTACVAEGITIIRNAAAEPHVQDLANFLKAMGADIKGIGTNTLEINGTKKLHGVDYTVCGDHIEAGSFLAMAAATGGEIEICGITPRNHWMTRRIFERFGIHFEMSNDTIAMPGDQKLRVRPDFDHGIPVVADGPWPQFPSDMMSCTIVMATQARGSVLFFEKMFESRIYFVDLLIRMGANAIVCDPHRVVVSGPSRLRAMEMSSPDIRAGMAMLIAALCARGTSTIHNATVISRGYQEIIRKISLLGGQISGF